MAFQKFSLDTAQAGLESSGDDLQGPGAVMSPWTQAVLCHHIGTRVLRALSLKDAWLPMGLSTVAEGEKPWLQDESTPRSMARDGDGGAYHYRPTSVQSSFSWKSDGVEGFRVLEHLRLSPGRRNC